MATQREIKFRAWDKKRGIFHWGISNICLTLGGNLMWQFGFQSPNFNDKEEIENYTLQQYTGLKDKKGNDIFDGDIFKVTCGCEHQENLPVEYKDGHNGFYAAATYQHDWDNNQLELNWAEGTEVVGNISENPEL